MRDQWKCLQKKSMRILSLVQIRIISSRSNLHFDTTNTIVSSCTSHNMYIYMYKRRRIYSAASVCFPTVTYNFVSIFPPQIYIYIYIYIYICTYIYKRMHILRRCCFPPMHSIHGRLANLIKREYMICSRCSFFLRDYTNKSRFSWTSIKLFEGSSGDAKLHSNAFKFLSIVNCWTTKALNS